MTHTAVSRWIIHPKGSQEYVQGKKRAREEKQRELRELKKATLISNDENFNDLKIWLTVNKGVGSYEKTYELPHLSSIGMRAAYTFEFGKYITNNTSCHGRFSEKPSENIVPLKTDTFYENIFVDPMLCDKTDFENNGNILLPALIKDKEIVNECKSIRDNLLEIIRETTGYIFVRGWSGYRVNTIILKAHCKQDKCHQVLKPRNQVKKLHDPDNLKQFRCNSGLSVHFNVKNGTVKVCYFHETAHETLPKTVVPDSLRNYISNNLCFTSSECFECLKRTPCYSDFVNGFDSKSIVRKLWKEVSESQWNQDPDSKISALKILKKFEMNDDVSILFSETKDPLLSDSLQKSKPFAFLYESVISNVKEDVTEIVIDATFSLCTDFRQYFVVVASYFGKGVPVGFMATQTNVVDYRTIKWFLNSVLEKMPSVRCINSDWSLAEVKAIKELNLHNQICLFHTLTAVRGNRFASRKTLEQVVKTKRFQKFLESNQIDHAKFDLESLDTLYNEKVSENQIRSITDLFRVAICDHIIFHTSSNTKVFEENDNDEEKAVKLYHFHLWKLYDLVVLQFSLPCYFSYLFNQYYNKDSFFLMSRVGKPGFFSNLRTSMMCESYFGQLKKWNMIGSRNYRFDTLVYILMNKDLPKIKDMTRITERFEKEYTSSNLVKYHKKHLPTWRKQWIIEWKALYRDVCKYDECQLTKECKEYGTDLDNWVCGCKAAKLSPSSSCVHLVAMYHDRYPKTSSYELQRFGKRNNSKPLVKHSTLQVRMKTTDEDAFEVDKSFEKTAFKLDSVKLQKSHLHDDEENDESESEEKLSSELNEEYDASEIHRKLDIFNFFISDPEMKQLIVESPSFQSIIEEMTYITKRSKKEYSWTAKTNKPEGGFQYQSWIRCIKYHQYYNEIRARGTYPLPV